MNKLEGKEVRGLRSRGQTIKSTVFVGKNGVTDTVITSVNNAFNTQELIKLKVQDGCPDDKRAVASKISEKAGCHVVQILGNTILFYRPDEEEA